MLNMLNMLNEACTKNAELYITGQLLYSKEFFVQGIKGTPAPMGLQ
jgi:hypothetical protein